MWLGSPDRHITSRAFGILDAKRSGAEVQRLDSSFKASSLSTYPSVIGPSLIQQAPKTLAVRVILCKSTNQPWRNLASAMSNEAFHLLSRGGVAFDKSRPETKLFTVSQLRRICGIHTYHHGRSQKLRRRRSRKKRLCPAGFRWS